MLRQRRTGSKRRSRRCAAAGEAACRLTTSAHRALLDTGVFDLFRPRSLGGEEADLLAMVRAVRTFSDEAREDGPLYRLPTVAAFGAAIAAVNLGVADHALDLLAEIAPSKKPVMSALTLQQKPNVHDRVGVALATHEAGAAYLERAVAEAWAIAEAGRRPTFAERGRLWLAATHASQCALQATEVVYTLAGSNSVYEDNVIDRCLRDARTAAQHVMTQVLNYEIAGKQRLGLAVQDSTWALDARPGDPA